MSREIKFRVWDNYHRCFLREDGCYLKDIYHVFDSHFDPRPEYRIMQYTGLKDKNGVEIYEGDIVEWVSTHKGATQNKHIDEVRWMDDGWLCLYPWIHEIGAAEMTIIGNIYENPELLEK